MYKSILEIKEKNKQVGRHFFSLNTMRFFSSKVESEVIKGRYFITSEKTGFDTTDRAYTIREARENGSIGQVGGFGAFNTIEEAEEYLETI